MPKIHSCPHCAREFKRLEHLQRHCRTHTKEKPFKCPCGACFTRRDLLRRHERLSHPNTYSPTGLSNDKHLNKSSTSLVEVPSHDYGSTINSNNISIPQFGSTPTPPPIVREDHAQGPQGMVIEEQDAAEIYTSYSVDPNVLGSINDFESFVKAMGLGMDWLEALPLGTVQGQFQDNPLPQNQPNHMLARSPSGFSQCGRDYSGPLPFSSSLLSHGRNTTLPDRIGLTRQRPQISPFTMTEGCLRELQSSLEPFINVLDDFDLPSCHTFTKCLSAWEEMIASHIPIIHIPTFSLSNCLPEFILALAALGAQQRFENHTSLLFFRASKAITLERISRRGMKAKENPTSATTKRNHLRTNTPRNILHLGILSQDREFLNSSDFVMQSASSILTLLIYATWARDSDIVTEGFEFHLPLLRCLRQSGLSDYNEPHSEEWDSWAILETERRVKFMAFCFLNLHTIAYNHQPSLACCELHLRLPCTVQEWDAVNEIQWRLARQENPGPQCLFQPAFNSLLNANGDGVPFQPAPSPFGNYILLHGLLQRIFVIRQLSVSQELPEDEITRLQTTLSAWASIWQRTSHLVLNPRDESGTISFTSVAILGLAHVRIYLNAGPYRELESRDPTRIAAALSKIPVPRRSSKTISALLYSIHALSIPVAIGIEYVAHSQSIFWCCQHSLSILECAIFLNKWLYQIAITGSTTPLTKHETHVISCLQIVLREAVTSVDWEETNTHLWVENPFFMGLAVLKIWSKIFGNSSAWPITTTIGKSLKKYAEHYEKLESLL